MSLTPSQVAGISEKHPAIGKIWQRFKGNIERPIAVILILNTTAHTMGASMAGAQFDRLFGTQYIWLFSLVFTFLMLQYTEILPKTLGVRFNLRLALVIARPLDLSIRILSPFITLLHLFNRPFEGRGAATVQTATLDEIRSLASMAKHANSLGAVQERIITEATHLQLKAARELMIPEPDVSMMSNTCSIQEAFIAAHIDAHTRYPVCHETDRRRVIGYVNFKELVYFMSTNPNQPSFQGIIRPALEVSENTTAGELLKAFIDQHEHLAIVKDAGGHCVGMITMEDLIEELVGDLQDEFDRLPHHIHPLEGGTYMFGGGVPIGNVFSTLGLNTEEQTSTLAAWLDSNLREVIRPGVVHEAHGVQFTVRRLRRAKAFEVSAVRINDR